MSICLIETKIKLYTDNNLRNKSHVYLGIFKLIFLNTTRFGTWYQIFVTVDFFSFNFDLSSYSKNYRKHVK
jgi:hypothetical protein